MAGSCELADLVYVVSQLAGRHAVGFAGGQRGDRGDQGDGSGEQADLHPAAGLQPAQGGDDGRGEAEPVRLIV